MTSFKSHCWEVLEKEKKHFNPFYAGIWRGGGGVEQALHGLSQSITSEKQKLEKPNIAFSNINYIHIAEKNRT